MTPEEWPTDDDLINLRGRWRTQGGTAGPYASYGTCKQCQNLAYRFGKTYEGMMCFDCFVIKNKPKKRRAKKTNL